MTGQPTRRQFLRSAAVGGGVLGWGGLGGFRHLRADDAPADMGRNWSVRYDADIEPIVRLIEETERERCVEVIGEQIGRGLSYREFLSAIFLAGLRNGADMGYYHCVYVIHAANQLAARTPAGEELLPLFGAMDLFKGWQTRRSSEPGHFGMQPVPKELRSSENARNQLDAAARAADPDGVEAAVVALSETVGRHRLFGILAKQGLLAGEVHHPILVCNCWRVLEAMDWRHYRPTVRAMARMLAADSGLRENWFRPLRDRARAEHGELPPDWSRRSENEGFTRDLLAVLRSGELDATVQIAADALFSGGASAGAVWDTVHLAAAESLLRYGGGNALHENTSLNALHYAFRTTAGDDDQLMILLAAVRRAGGNYHASRNVADQSSILELAAADLPESFADAADDIFRTTVQEGAVPKAFALAQTAAGRLALARAQRRVVVAKARNDAHPYKLAVANQEDCRFVSSRWRPYIVAAAAGMQRGGDDDVTDNPDAVNILEAREVLGRV